MNVKTLISAAVLSTALFASNAYAVNVTVSDAWARASAGMAKAGGAFMTLTNTAQHDHVVVSASSDISDRVELHTHIMANGVMQMREVEGGIKVPAGETIMLAPGGLHVMFLGLHAPLKEGTTFDLTLTFDSGRSTTTQVKVMSVSAMKGMGAMDHSGHSGDMGKKTGDMGDMGNMGDKAKKPHGH